METKPDPAGAKAILNELKLDAGSTAFVGDTWIDMQTARNTGCIAVGVLWGFRDRRELEKKRSPENSSRALMIFTEFLQTTDQAESFSVRREFIR